MSAGGRQRARTDAEIAEVIRGLAEGRPQRELADLLGIDQSGISRALSGRRAFNLREVALIADWSGKQPEDILFSEPSAFAFRCSEDISDCDATMRQCRTVVQDYLAFRTVAE
jgi:transcriptional regulator with XRE-family HTH domain